ncbi:potassium transporter TrkG [Hirschia baltica]|uniref:Cation transporter n=1 Tax=Hirschia baltica (strain ATCC 49814 / DSM 5838 / IFAM 1418) TaxID=582402 RepID=C6XJQ1_HIRBI|nr:potassium transporter TrkG [Hirschia baltica]ACT59346.1 cation transporter [Hirschia baltica ATCC 49814]
MNLSSVLKHLGLTAIVIGACALLCGLFASISGDASSARGFLFSGVLGTFLGGSFLILLWDVPAKTGAREGLLFVLGFWFLMPLIAAPPFWASGVSNSWIEASFEAVSNLTTTGTTAGEAVQPDSIRYWRAILQFIGGVLGVVMAVIVLAALNLSGPGVHRSHLLTLTRDDLFGRIGRITATVALVYGIAAIIGTFAIVLAGAEFIDAFTRSLAAISTSATLSGAAGAYAYSPAAAAVITLLLFIGATNIALHADILRQSSWRVYLRDTETQILILGVLAFVLLMAISKQKFDFRLISEALSFVSTSGMNVTGSEKVLDILPQPIPDVFVFVGAAALSTAGGLKMTRVLVLFSRALTEFKRLSFEHSTAKLKFQGRTRADAIVVGVWVYLIAYLGAAIILGMLLALTGLNVENAFRGAIGAIANAGPLMDAAVVDQSPSSTSLFVLAIGCILGRIEVLALAPLFSSDFWRK